jgi:cytochrome b561
VTTLRDTPARYGAVSRAFHWAMAILILWQTLVAIGFRLLSEDTMRGVTAIGPSHGGKGVLILLLILPRAVWALANRHRRPPAERGWSGTAASAVHLLLYVAMLAIPLLALLGAWGSGKGLTVFGLTLLPATGHENATLVMLAQRLHGPLGWALAALVAVHIGAALLHALVWRDGVLRRMIG